jgi:hypothetical protein
LDKTENEVKSKRPAWLLSSKDRTKTGRSITIIIIAEYTIVFNEEINVSAVLSQETVQCPLCGGCLTKRDSRPRFVIRENGERETWIVRRLQCRSCGKLHTELPDFILPFKHYEAQTIQNTLDDKADNSCAADDATLRCWRQSFSEACSSIIALLTAFYMKAENKAAPLFQFENILVKLRARQKNWLTFVFRLLINSGNRLRTRFAFCP